MNRSIKADIDGCTYELKEICVSENRSDETLCFDALAYCNGRYIGQVWNNGDGGPTHIPVPEHMEPEMDMLADNLTRYDTIKTYNGKEYAITMDIELFTDVLVHEAYYYKTRKFTFEESHF